MSELSIGLLSVSDRASDGVYEDAGVPALRTWLRSALTSPWTAEERLTPDDFAAIRDALMDLVDRRGCSLVLTTGGTGPAPRDVTPEATLAVSDRELPGIGEQMRRVSLRHAPTAILSRQTAVIRGRALIMNLPGQPKAVAETLGEVFAAIPYCLELIGAPSPTTNPATVEAFRPKSAGRR